MEILRDKKIKYIFISIIILFIGFVLFQIDNSYQFIRLALNGWMVGQRLLDHINFFLHFDSFMIWGFAFFQILLIFIIPISGVILYQRFHTIFKFEAVKYKNQKKFITRKVLLYSSITALSVFIGYLFFYLLACWLLRVENDGIMYRTLFVDILGADFYFNHRKLYYLLEGATRFLVIPYIYSILSCSFVFYVKKKYYTYLIPVVYWIGGLAIGYFLYYVMPNSHYYFSPSYIMASGTYDANTMLTFLPHLLVLAFSIFLCRRAGEKYEI